MTGRTAATPNFAINFYPRTGKKRYMTIGISSKESSKSCNSLQILQTIKNTIDRYGMSLKEAFVALADGKRKRKLC